MSLDRPLRDAAVRTVLMTVAVAVGIGLARRGWGDAFLATAVFAPVAFVVMWAILNRKQDGEAPIATGAAASSLDPG